MKPPRKTEISHCINNRGNVKFSIEIGHKNPTKKDVTYTRQGQKLCEEWVEAVSKDLTWYYGKQKRPAEGTIQEGIVRMAEKHGHKCTSVVNEMAGMLRMVTNYLEVNHPTTLNDIKNDLHIDLVQQRFKMFKTGFLQGMTDLVVMLKTGTTIYMEIKTPVGVMSQEQRVLADWLKKSGHIHLVCRGFYEAEYFMKLFASIDNS